MLTVADFEAPFYGLSRRGSSANPLRVPVIVVAMNLRNRPGTPVLDGLQLQRLVFGPGPSVVEWLDEMSQGRLILVPHPTVPVVGPILSRFDWQFYYREGPWLPTSLPVGDPHRWVDTTGAYGPVDSVRYLDDDGYIGGQSHSWGEMMRAADAEPLISLSSYNVNGDPELDPTECLFLLVKNEVRTGGNRRPVHATQVPLPAQPLTLDGVTVKVISEFYTSPPHDHTDLAVCGEELLHLVADLDDQYPDTGATPSYRSADDPGRPGQFSMSDAVLPRNDHRPVHVDPYHKLKWGWLNPQLASASGTYSLRPAATTGDALILANPHVGTREFFIVENRWRGTSYDRFREPACGDGLAVWHCIQDASLQHSWARRAVHLRRANPAAGPSGPPQDSLALFDGGVSGQDYDLHDNSAPTSLRFLDGSPSRLAIRNISPAKETMTLDVSVPPEPGSLALAAGRVTRLRVHERSTGYGPPGQKLPQDCVVSIDTEPGGTFGIDICQGPEARWMFELVREAFARGDPVRLEYRSDTSYGGEVLRVLRT